MPIRDKIADGFAAVDELVEDAQSALKARMAGLIGSTDGRIEAIWADAGVPEGMTLKVVQGTPIPMRDEEWMKAVSSMMAAAKWQAFLEIMASETIKKIAKHTKRTKDAASNMTTEELKAAAQQGVTKEQFEAAKTKRKQRTTTA